MNILGIGPLELVLIAFIALIVLGPNDLVKTGRTLGRWMRKVVMSQEWKAIQSASRELRTLPNKLIREAGIEEAQKAIKEQVTDVRRISQGIQGDIKHIQTDLSSWITPSQTIEPPHEDITDPNENIASPIQDETED